VARERGLTDWMALVLVFVPVIVISEAVWYFGGIAAVGGVAVVLAFWLVLNQLVLAVFAGWVMKISHVRKALQLPSEAVYNVWRVAIRWVAPIVLVTALVQMLRAWLPV
ncbi:MAG: hypothetical protein VW625_08825, partial [Perlucidibaca sp.]